MFRLGGARKPPVNEFLFCFAQNIPPDTTGSVGAGPLLKAPCNMTLSVGVGMLAAVVAANNLLVPIDWKCHPLI